MKMNLIRSHLFHFYLFHFIYTHARYTSVKEECERENYVRKKNKIIQSAAAAVVVQTKKSKMKCYTHKKEIPFFYWKQLHAMLPKLIHCKFCCIFMFSLPFFSILSLLVLTRFSLMYIKREWKKKTSRNVHCMMLHFCETLFLFVFYNNYI
jgi:hypothetical protein